MEKQLENDSSTVLKTEKKISEKEKIEKLKKEKKE